MKHLKVVTNEKQGGWKLANDWHWPRTVVMDVLSFLNLDAILKKYLFPFPPLSG
jgi:hypothetical protein